MSKRVRILTAVLFPCAAVLIYIFRNSITEAGQMMPECAIHKLTGAWCTGCGNTRSVNALLHGQLWRAVRYNPSVPFLVLVSLLFYAETVIGIWNDRVKLLPRKKWIWWTILALFLAFFILRNFISVLTPVS
jgi:hypothetical protein